MGGKSFTTPCTLSRNGHGVKTTALADTGANAFALIDTQCAQKLSEFLNTPLETLKEPVPLRGFDGHAGTPITKILRCNLSIDQRRQYNLPFLVTDLGSHDIILGRIWLAYLDLWLDVRNRQLLWPASLPPTPSFVKMITRTMDSLRRTTRLEPKHQEDLVRRDVAFQQDLRLDGKRMQILRRPQSGGPPAEDVTVDKSPDHGINPGSKPPRSPSRTPWTPKGIEKRTEHLDRIQNYRQMKEQLENRVATPTTPWKRPSLPPKTLPSLDICAIGAVGFFRNIKHPDSVTFMTSIYEIDSLIRKREVESEAPELTDEQPMPILDGFGATKQICAIEEKRKRVLWSLWGLVGETWV